MTRPNVTAQSSPRYDGWGPDSPWGCEEWIAWHRALSAAHGTARADEVWAAAWLAGLSRAGGGRGTARGSGAVFDSVPVGCRTLNNAFRDYVAARPALRAAVWGGFGGAIVAPLAGVASVAQGFGYAALGAGRAIENNGPLVVVGLLAIAYGVLRSR